MVLGEDDDGTRAILKRRTPCLLKSLRTSLDRIKLALINSTVTLVPRHYGV